MPNEDAQKPKATSVDPQQTQSAFGQSKTGWSEERLVLTGVICLAILVGIVIGLFVFLGGGNIG